MRRVLVATASLSVLSHEAGANFFNGRSGELLIRTSQPDASIVYISESDLIQQSEERAIDVTDIAGTVARTLGVVPPTKEALGFQKTSFFHRAQANLLIALEGVGSSNFEGMPNLAAMNEGKFAKGQVQRLALKTEACSSDSVGLLSCVSSGFPASQTGIVGSSWKNAMGHRERAFASSAAPQTWSAKANLADRVVQSFDGQSLALSFSGSSQDAAAFCVHPQLAATAAHSFCVHPEASSVAESLAVKLPRTKEDLLAIFEQQSSENLLWVLGENKKGAVAVDSANSQVTVLVGGDDNGEHVVLDLSSKVELDLLLELQSFHMLAKSLGSSTHPLHALVKDDAPDVYFGTFSALVPLTEKHGAGSSKMKAARQLLDASVVLFVRSWAQLYEGKVLAEVVALGSPANMVDALHKVQELAPELRGNAADYFPAVYAPSSSSSSLCQRVQAGLKGTSFEVLCAPAGSTHGRSLLQQTDSPTAAPTANPEPVVGDDARNTYQIMVWVSVAGAFTVLFAFYSTAFMGFKKDTLLYSSFNPKWDDRKTK